MRNLLERLVAAIGLLLASPFLLVAMVLVKLTSHGPAIFRQERVGLHRNSFVCLKLRTMSVGTKQAGTHEVGASALTPVGGFLRKTKLDELPQLVNVMRGEMRFVGPRPCLPSQKELIRERGERDVFSVLPGITGLGQVRGIDMSDPVRLAKVDAEYVESRSWTLDFRLILQTITGSGQGDRVNTG